MNKRKVRINQSIITLLILAFMSLSSCAEEIKSVQSSTREISSFTESIPENMDSIRRTLPYLKEILNEEVLPLKIDSVNQIKQLHEFNQDVRVNSGIKSITKEWYHLYKNSNTNKRDTLTAIPLNCRVLNYSKTGLLKHKYLAFKEDTTTKISYFYNEANKLIKVSETNRKTSDNWEHHFIYDEKHNLLRKSSQYDGNYLTIYNYDSLGRIISKKLVNEEMVHGEKLLSYYENTPLVKEVEMKSSQVNSKFEYEYDNQGRKISEKYKSSFNNNSGTITFSYDRHGNLILRSSKGSFSSTEKFEYEYNKKGDWIKKIRYYNGVKMDEIVRVITYYR